MLITLTILCNDAECEIFFSKFRNNKHFQYGKVTIGFISVLYKYHTSIPGVKKRILNFPNYVNFFNEINAKGYEWTV